jgi:predicted DNA-binding transcriptional regulator AlpA
VPHNRGMNDDLDELLNEREAANLLRVSSSTMERWRADGVGPRFVKLSVRAIRYRFSDLRAFVLTHEVPPGEKQKR